MIEARESRGDADHRGTSQTDKDVDPGRQSSGTDPECLSPAGVVLRVIMGQVEIPVGADEHNDVEIRILLDEAGEVAELGDGRRRDRVNRRVVERHMAVSGLRRSTLKCVQDRDHTSESRALLDGPVSIVFMSNS